METWDEVCRALDNKKLLVTPFCGETPCEELFKKESARLLPPPFVCSLTQSAYV